jgi:mono/diheme cytochrome c family protein
MLKPLVATSLTLALFCAAAATQVKAAPADPVKAPANNAAAVQAGQQVFLKNCFPCHSTIEGQQKVGPSLYHVNSGPHPRHTATEIRGFLQNGKKGTIGTMPPFKDILTKEDTDNLLAYVHTL